MIHGLSPQEMLCRTCCLSLARVVYFLTNQRNALLVLLLLLTVVISSNDYYNNILTSLIKQSASFIKGTNRHHIHHHHLNQDQKGTIMYIPSTSFHPVLLVESKAFLFPRKSNSNSLLSYSYLCNYSFNDQSTR